MFKLFGIGEEGTGCWIGLKTASYCEEEIVLEFKIQAGYLDGSIFAPVSRLALERFAAELRGLIGVSSGGCCLADVDMLLMFIVAKNRNDTFVSLKYKGIYPLMLAQQVSDKLELPFVEQTEAGTTLVLGAMKVQNGMEALDAFVFDAIGERVLSIEARREE